MTTKAITPLRQRMIEDMNARKLCAGTQRGHILSCKRLAAFLERSPDRSKVHAGSRLNRGAQPTAPKSVQGRCRFVTARCTPAKSRAPADKGARADPPIGDSGLAVWRSLRDRPRSRAAKERDERAPLHDKCAVHAVRA
jgi:hypothetical protein